MNCIGEPLQTFDLHNLKILLEWYLHSGYAAALLLLISTVRHLMFPILAKSFLTLPQSVLNSVIVSCCKEEKEYVCICMYVCVQGFRPCHRPHSLSNGFRGNSCQEASETPVKACRWLFTALNPMTFPCKAERDEEGRVTCFMFSHQRHCRQGI